MNEQSRSDAPDDGDVAALLRAVGARQTASAQAMAEVQAAVVAEWRASVAARQHRRRVAGWAAAASVAVAAIGVWLARPLLQVEPQLVASLTRVVGSVEQNRGDGRWTPLEATGSIESGAEVRTATGGRAALQLANGVELRLDARTRIAFQDMTRARLAQGAVYVDAGVPSGVPSPPFELDTPAGSVTHLGTQYEARIQDGSVRVGVREGRVRVARGSSDLVGDAGESLTLRGDEVIRAPLARTAAEWGWTADVTPPFSIEGRSVEDFLVWAARQTGRTLVYASSDAAQQARSVTLSGTVAGLTPDEAVQAVLSTTSLAPQIGTEHIRVESAAR
ncbi:MAG: FecR family protein [Steroidobacteraceae bacterium]|nr:FecR family protein [Steroidobacteraceae bacterium]